MTFTRSVLQPKETYTAQEHARAAEVLATWITEEPRCRVQAGEVLRLRSDGPMLLFTGSGTDLNRWVQVCFIRKGPPRFVAGSLRLFAACGVVDTRQDFTLLVARAIRDVLQNGAPLVYFTRSRGEDQVANKFINALPAIITSLPLIDPNLFSVDIVDEVIGEGENQIIASRTWKVTLA